eukprot:TRINITY_DN55185_c0_g1_i1.p1 TRINITY_DN55185_c0_g1~~TRINITY_DN55185_c0_g1_i1.p1  ORF type:complete len:416 (+),score=68.14 TRINITY_DN55185_c0_g1_i1:78-1325(+)
MATPTSGDHKSTRWSELSPDSTRIGSDEFSRGFGSVDSGSAGTASSSGSGNARGATSAQSALSAAVQAAPAPLPRSRGYSAGDSRQLLAPLPSFVQQGLRTEQPGQRSNPLGEEDAVYASVRNTFLEFHVDTPAPLSPRAESDPGADANGSTVCDPKSFREKATPFSSGWRSPASRVNPQESQPAPALAAPYVEKEAACHYMAPPIAPDMMLQAGPAAPVAYGGPADGSMPMMNCNLADFAAATYDGNIATEPTLELTNEQVTTLMIGGLPCKVDYRRMITELYRLGFDGSYDYVYLPKKSYSRGFHFFGYGFINFLNHDEAMRFATAFDNYRFEGSTSAKRGNVQVAAVQGREANMNLFSGRNRGEPRAYIENIGGITLKAFQEAATNSNLAAVQSSAAATEAAFARTKRSMRY